MTADWYARGIAIASLCISLLALIWQIRVWRGQGYSVRLVPLFLGEEDLLSVEVLNRGRGEVQVTALALEWTDRDKKNHHHSVENSDIAGDSPPVTVKGSHSAKLLLPGSKLPAGIRDSWYTKALFLDQPIVVTVLVFLGSGKNIEGEVLALPNFSILMSALERSDAPTDEVIRSLPARDTPLPRNSVLPTESDPS